MGEVGGVLIGGGLGACVGLVCVRSVWSFMVVLDGVWDACCSGCILGRGLYYVKIDSFGGIFER